MGIKRVAKRDDDVDRARTIYWFRCLGDRLNTYQPREIQRAIAPATMGVNDEGDPIKNSKFLGYSRGEHVPYPALMALAEMAVPRSTWALNHPLWMVLRRKESITGVAYDWIRQLDPEVQGIVVRPYGEIASGANRHTLGSLERRASMDSLAVLTILLLLSREKGEDEWAWLYAHSIFRVLLMIGPHLEHRMVAERVFRIFVQRIFSVVSLNGQRMALEEYDYLTKSWLLQELTMQVREKQDAKRERKMPTFYALQVLNGNCGPRFSRCFQIPLVAEGPSAVGAGLR